MGRGAYDTTNPTDGKSAAAMEAIRQHNIERARQANIAAEAQTVVDYEKLVRSKKSRGIVAARNAAKEEAARAEEAAASSATQADAYESEGECDAATKP